MKALFKPTFFALVFLAIMGASLVVSSEVVSEGQDPLGNLNLPEGIDLVNQLPENVVAGAVLPNNESRIEDQELGNGSEGNKQIVIHLGSQTMDMVENGTVLNSFKISSGKRTMQTPTGTFLVLSKVPRAYSKTYGLYMPYWMAFTTLGHGIHELPEWPNGSKEGEDHLGKPVSHGCVRLGVGPAKILYEWAEIKTPVLVVP